MKFNKTILLGVLMTSGALVSHGQTIFENFVDTLNLEDVQPDLVLAWLTPNKLELESAWKAINDLEDVSLEPVTIGVIDTRIDGSHEEFQNVHFGFSEDGSKSLPLLFPKIHGTGVVGIIGANNISSNSPDDYEEPHMNGILGGIHDLDYTIELRPPNWEFFGVQVDPFGTIFGLRQAITELHRRDVSIINISVEGPVSKIVRDRIAELEDKILFVVAAGNGGSDRVGDDADTVSPAHLGDELNNVITVAAVDNADSRLSFSNFGNSVNISAPGARVFAPGFFEEPLDLDDYQTERVKNITVGGFSGTSPAAPFITGVAGLLKALNPSLSPGEIKQILIETGDVITTDRPIGPRLNAFRAVCDPRTNLVCESQFSPWLSSSAYQQFFNQQLSQNRFPRRVEGRLSGSQSEFRGLFVPFLPQPFSFESRHGMTSSFFAQRNSQLLSQGFQRIWDQSFIDAAAIERFQATWTRGGAAASIQSIEAPLPTESGGGGTTGGGW